MYIKKHPNFKKSILGKSISFGLAISLCINSLYAVADSLPAGTVADSNTSAAQQAAIRAAFSAPLAMTGTAEIDPGFLTLVGARVTGLDSCDGDIGLSITNSFTDGTLVKIYENFEDIVEAVISTGGLIFLSSLYLQKSNAGLYNVLTNGINIGIDDFLDAIGSCEAILRSADSFVSKALSEEDSTTKTAQAIKNADDNDVDLSDYDLVKLLEDDGDVSISDLIALGRSFYDDDGQPATVAGEDAEETVVSVVSTGMAVGYCILRGIDEDDCNASGSNQEADSFAADITTHPMFEIMFGDDEDEWMSNVQDIAEKIYGEILYTDCEDCTAVNQAGMGLQRFFESQVADLASDITTRVDSSLSTLTAAKIDAISAPNAIVVTAPYIQAIQMYEDRPSIQGMMIKALATEVAYHRAIYISTLFRNIFQAVTTDEKTISAHFTGQYEYLIKINKEQYETFIAKEQSLGFVPGRYAQMILSMADGEGNVNSILQSQSIGSN